MGLQEKLAETYRNEECGSEHAALFKGARIALESLPCQATGVEGPALCDGCSRCRALSELTEGR